MSSMNKETFVMNNKTGKAYYIKTDTVQTRNRRQVIGFEIRNPERTRISESHLTPIKLDAAMVCLEAEKIIRGKHKRTKEDYITLAMHKALQNEIVNVKV